MSAKKYKEEVEKRKKAEKAEAKANQKTDEWKKQAVKIAEMSDKADIERKIQAKVEAQKQK